MFLTLGCWSLVHFQDQFYDFFYIFSFRINFKFLEKQEKVTSSQYGSYYVNHQNGKAQHHPPVYFANSASAGLGNLGISQHGSGSRDAAGFNNGRKFSLSSLPMTEPDEKFTGKHKLSFSLFF